MEAVRKELRAMNVDLWADWYREEAPLKILLRNETLRISFEERWNLDICSACRKASEIVETKWSNFKREERLQILKVFVDAPIWNSQFAINELAKIFRISASELRTKSHFYLLNDSEFRIQVSRLGYDGPIYFRAITAPDPANLKNRIILLNDDLLNQLSPFDSSLLKMFEAFAILIHEFSHVAQDIAASNLNLELQVTSPESALLIEGQAEYFAEQSLNSLASYTTGPSPLKLFVAENSVEIVYREGQEQQGNLFPYKVGLPFAAALIEFGNQKGLTDQEIQHSVFYTIAITKVEAAIYSRV